MDSMQQESGIRLIKPIIVSHCDSDSKTRNAIYSIDIQKDGERMATGGGDSFVKIWNLPALLSTPDICDTALQASLCNHTKSVNVVRWSHDGQFLASGSDDCYILIYKHDSSGSNMQSQPFGSSAIKNKECWSRCLTLHGHTMDVLDLDWSPKGFIASGSIDNKILIWDLTEMFAKRHGRNLATVASPFRVLDNHKSFVKGVAFDPVGSFLASTSADNVVIIWNMDTWTPDSFLTEPMADSVDRTIFRRMSWAPDGGSLCLSSATKAAKPVGMVVKRDSWESLADLVGHDTQSTCCRFSPCIKVAEKRKKAVANGVDGTPTNMVKKKQLPCTTVALGDHQGVVSVWSTMKNTPLLVLREVFTGPVLDISWTSLKGDLSCNCPSQAALPVRNSLAGCTTDLLACTSLDGTVALAMFNSGALSGKFERVMNAEEQEAHFRKMYGRAQSEILETPEPLLEGPTVLKYRNGHQNDKSGILSRKSNENIHLSNFENASNETSNGQSRSIVTQLEPRRLPLQEQQPHSKQKVTVLKSGKKRIQPMLLNSANSEQGVLLNNSSTTAADNHANDSCNNDSFRTHPARQFSEQDSGTKRVRLSCDENVFNGGTSVSSALHMGRVISLGFLHNSIICRSATVSGVEGEPFRIMGIVKKNNKQSSSGLSSLLSGMESDGLTKIVTSLKAEILPCPTQFGRVKHFNNTLSHIKALNIENASVSCDVASTKNESDVVWDAYITGEVTAICGLQFSPKCHSTIPLSTEGDGICVVGTNDGTLHLLSLESGMRLSPAFVVGAPIISIDLVMLDNVISRILLVNAEGDVLLYDHIQSITKSSNTVLSFVSKTSLRPLLVSMRCGMSTSCMKETSELNHSTDDLELEVQRAYLSKNGDIVVSIRSKKQVSGGNWQTFQFCKQSQLWMRVADMRNLLSGVFMGISAPHQQGAHSNPEDVLETLHKEAIRENNLSMTDILAVSRASRQAQSAGDMCSYTSKMTLSHIEERIATAFSLRSISEARLWLSEWTTFCCKHRLHNKIRWVVNRLVMASKKEDSFDNDEGNQAMFDSWAWLDSTCHKIFGVLKIDILRNTILPAISRSDNSQSLLIELTDTLDSIITPE